MQISWWRQCRCIGELVLQQLAQSVHKLAKTLHSQPTGTGSEEVRPVDQSLTSKKTVLAAATSVSAQV